MYSRLAAFFLILVMAPAWAAEGDRNLGVARAQDGQRVALVVGNSAYQQGPLRNPVNDARAMAARLRNLGFDVILREDLRTREIGGVYREFRGKISPGGVALVFYAGHGVQFKGQNYFPAVDSDIASEEDVPLQSLNLGTLLDNMEEAKAGVSLVLLDACRDNPFARRFRSGSRGLAKVEAASGTLIHYATKPGSVAADGDGRNGTYTEALLELIGEPGVPVEMLLKRVANRVVDKTGGKQEPWVEGSLRGEFYFNTRGAAATPVPSAPAPQADAETVFWSEVKANGTREYLEAYLSQYPQGRYQALAKLELRKFDGKDRPDRMRAGQAVRALFEDSQVSSDVWKDGADYYVLTSDTSGGGGFLTNPDGTKSHAGSIVLLRLSADGTMTRSVLARAHAHHLALHVGADRIRIFFNEKKRNGTYLVDGRVIDLDKKTLQMTGERVLFSEANWGWFPTIGADGRVSHFSFDGYLQCVDARCNARTEPGVMSDRYAAERSRHSGGLPFDQTERAVGLALGRQFGL
jgi:uncharacterized caspase-like protein